MADFVFNRFKEALGGAVFISATETILYASALSSPSTINVAFIIGDLTATSSPEDLLNVNAVLTATGIDEYTHASYARKALTTRTIAKNTTTDTITFNGAVSTWSALSANTAQSGADCDGVLVYWEPSGSSGDTQNVPLFYFDLKNATPSSLSFNGNGGNVTITWSNGLVTLT